MRMLAMASDSGSTPMNVLPFRDAMCPRDPRFQQGLRMSVTQHGSKPVEGCVLFSTQLVASDTSTPHVYPASTAICTANVDVSRCVADCRDTRVRVSADGGLKRPGVTIVISVVGSGALALLSLVAIRAYSSCSKPNSP